MPSVARAYLVDHPLMKRKADCCGQAPLAGENFDAGSFWMNEAEGITIEDGICSKLRKLVGVQEMVRARRQSCGCHLLEGQGSATKSGSDRRSSVNLAWVSSR
jgi:hypothetical protein